MRVKTSLEAIMRPGYMQSQLFDNLCPISEQRIIDISTQTHEFSQH